MLILASTSRYRRELLERLCLPFQVVAPACDEEGLDHLRPEERAIGLAIRKAKSVAALHPKDVVIGSDQIAVVDGESLPKPGNMERARETLGRLSGREHRLVTGVAVVDNGGGGRLEIALDIARLRMRTLSDTQIRDYLAREDTLDCAGAYRIEGLGAALFESITTEDPTGIIGLPLTRVVDLLSLFDIQVLN